MITAAVVQEVQHLDWTAIVVASIAAFAAVFGAWQGRLNAKAIRENARLLRTNSGMTIGEHIESLQGELARIARDKAEADAALASAALVAVAKLAVAQEPPPLSEQAKESARKLLEEADKAAEKLKEEN